jgi:hypothetical protein
MLAEGRVGGTAIGVTFGGTSGELDLERPQDLSGTISNWQVGDIIDFVNTSVTSASITRSRTLALPDNVSLLFLPPYSPELNPKENIWREIREKIFKNYALKSIDAVRVKLDQAILYLERSPDIVKCIAGFPYIVNSL